VAQELPSSGMGTNRTIDRHEVANRLASGQTVARIARDLNADAKHMGDIAREPEVERLVAEHRRMTAERVRSGIVQGATVGVQTLIEAASNADGTVPWSVRVTAASRLVEAAVGRHLTVDTGASPADEAATSPTAMLRDALETIEARSVEVVTAGAPQLPTGDGESSDEG